MQTEKGLVRSLLIYLFLVLMIVYTWVRQTRTPAPTKESQQTSQEWETNIVQEIEEKEEQPKTQNIVNVNDTNTSNTKSTIEPIVPSKSITRINNTNLRLEENTNNTETNDNTASSNKKMVILPQTSIYIWGLASLQKLSINYEYILKDDQNIYYVYLGKQEQDFWAIARAYNGNIVEIVTDVELQKHQLFGNAITFINIPQYKNNLVLMIVYINNDIRLVQVDFEKYHNAKWYIKERFNY